MAGSCPEGGGQQGSQEAVYIRVKQVECDLEEGLRVNGEIAH